MIITHNLTAMNAQRQYKVNIDSQKKTTEKLSSGYRINRAADDAAGLTISEKMRSMIRGLNQGSYNTQDGISWVQVADGAMNEIHDMVHRLKELAVKSANGTNTDADRAAINQEAQAIIDEINKIDRTTEFNTKNVFLRGNVALDVDQDPGDLEFFNATRDADGKSTYGGFIFHGKRIEFPAGMIKMDDNGNQVFNEGTYKITDGDKFFTIQAEKGALVPDAKRIFDLKAKDDGIYIDGTRISWDNVIHDSGRSFTELGPEFGTWSLKYGKSNIDITIGTNCIIRSKAEFVSAVNDINKIQENGGVSYQWVSTLTDITDEKSVYLDDATFFGGSNSRNIDNAMAYDTNSDKLNTTGGNNLSDPKKMGYFLRADLINSDATELANRGTDKGVNLVMYLVGSDGNKIEGSNVIYSIPDSKSDNPAISGTDKNMSSMSGAHSVTSWSSGTDTTDGDFCDGHIRDGITDYSFKYVDPSGKTDITFEFKLSDISSADTVEDGLNLARFVQTYSGQYTDYIELSSNANSKVNITDAGTGVKTYKVSYGMETALGRDFSDAHDVLAEIDGSTVGDEGKIVRGTNSISFKVSGDDKDKTSSNYAASKAENNVGIIEFSADTTSAEKGISGSIMTLVKRLISEKKDNYVAGLGSDSTSVVSSIESKFQLTDKDSDVRVFGTVYNNDFSKNRTYEYTYDYADILNKYNDGTRGDTTAFGKKITIIDEADDGTFTAGKTLNEDRYFKLDSQIKVKNNLTNTYVTKAAGSYIDARTLKKLADDISSDISNHLSDTEYIYDDVNKKYTTADDYKKVIESLVSAANKKGNDGFEYTILDDGSIKETSELKDYHKNDYDQKIDDICNGFVTTGYFEADGTTPLLGENLRTTILSNIDSMAATYDADCKSRLKDFIASDSIDFSTLQADSDGNFDVAGLITDSAKDTISNTLASKKVQDIKDDKNKVNIDLLIPADTDPVVKALMKNNVISDKIPEGSFYMTEGVKAELFNKSAIATAAVNGAEKLGDSTAPAISDEQLSKILENAINESDGTVAPEIFDKIKDYLVSHKSDLTMSDGKIGISKALADEITLAVIYDVSDGAIRTLKAKYGDDILDDELKAKEFDSRVGYNTTSGELYEKLNSDAKAYASQAMQDVADSTKFVMKSTGYSSVAMSTVKPENKVARANYDSEIEIDYNNRLYIQHSNVVDDNTEIQQFVISSAALKISSLRLNTEMSAKKALTKLDYALSYVSARRSELGATQNRLEHTYNNNRNKEENLTAAESRIRDAEMADEMVRLSRHNILVQVGESVMAQANQSKQGVMVLLNT